MWTAVKIVISENNSMILGCVVGPFESEDLAQHYCESAVIGSLGYEKWVTRELQAPSEI